MHQKIKKIFEVLRHVDDHQKICLVVLKNTNDHALLFKAYNDSDNYVMNSTWLVHHENTEGTTYYEKELSILDRSLMSVTINSDSTIELPISVNRTCNLVFDDQNRPAVLTTINEESARLDIVYVHLEPDSLDKTVITISGRSLDSGLPLEEKIVIDLSWIPSSFI